MLSMLFVVYNPPSAYIVGYKTVYLQYIRQAVVKDALVFSVSAICVIIMCCFLLYDVNNSAQYEYYGIAYLSEISNGGHEENNRFEPGGDFQRQLQSCRIIGESGFDFPGMKNNSTTRGL